MTRIAHNPRCAIFYEPPGLRDPRDCNCGAIPPLPKPQPLAVAEDPVREAAREIVDVWLRAPTTRALVQASVFPRLREALAQPAPPSLTEDERKALCAELTWLDGGMPPNAPNPFRFADKPDNVKFSNVLRSAREKLS